MSNDDLRPNSSDREKHEARQIAAILNLPWRDIGTAPIHPQQIVALEVDALGTPIVLFKCTLKLSGDSRIAQSVEGSWPPVESGKPQYWMNVRQFERLAAQNRVP